GAGLVDVGAAAASEVAVVPASLAFGRAARPGWFARETVVIRNISTRRVAVSLFTRRTGAAARIRIDAVPARVQLRPGTAASVTVTARALGSVPRSGLVTGTLRLDTGGGPPLRVPWAIPLGPAPDDLVGAPVLSPPAGTPAPKGRDRRGPPSFKASDTAPAVVTVRVGRLSTAGNRVNVQPLLRLDLELATAAGKPLGVLTRLRDVLPGRYTFGLTGRGPRGGRLAKGVYRLRLVPVRPDGTEASAKSLEFRIK
ncbi:MAG: hypothetical protein M3M94_01350, partial [Actinomycetota bacterium]|nr:hypothetical protein [Actinomycetota bacterium]